MPVAKVKGKKSAQSLTLLRRKLRPFLPGKVEWDADDMQYTVEGKVIVQLNYYCSWDSKTGVRKNKDDIAKSCNPHSITLQPCMTLVTSSTGYCPHKRSAVFRDRTFQKRLDGEFNLEAIATGITKSLESFDRYLGQLKENETLKKAMEKRKKKAMLALQGILPAGKWTDCGDGYYMVDKEAEDDEVEKATVRYRFDDSNDSARSSPNSAVHYRLDLEGLTADQAKKVLKLVL